MENDINLEAFFIISCVTATLKSSRIEHLMMAICFRITFKVVFSLHQHVRWKQNKFQIDTILLKYNMYEVKHNESNRNTCERKSVKLITESSSLERTPSEMDKKFVRYTLASDTFSTYYIQ